MSVISKYITNIDKKETLLQQKGPAEHDNGA
jgi:hypothetical protein